MQSSLFFAADFGLRPCLVLPNTKFPFFPSVSPFSSSLNLKTNLVSSSPHFHSPTSALSCQTSRDLQVTLPSEDVAVHGLSETIVGVLGGGQLSRMLCQAASQMGIKVMVLDPQKSCLASQLAYYHMLGSFDDIATVQQFAKRCGVLIVEIEHVNVETLEKLEHQGVDCQPKASTIRIIQDKYLQKVHFLQHGIPLPEFMQIDDLDGAKRAGNLFDYPLMIKSKRLAYDGSRNAVAKNEEDLTSAITSLGGFDRSLYVEKWAHFVKELVVIVAKGRDNSIVCYRVVETIHKENICHIVKAPANVPRKIQELATNIASRAVSLLEGAGVFVVELFLTKDNQILLNEVVPRPQNSGYHTIESCYTSQYEQHIRAVVGLPLGDPSMKTPAAIMYNLLGENEKKVGSHLCHQVIEGGLIISDMRKQRKMCHITIVSPSLGDVEKALNSMLDDKISDSQPADTPRVGIIMGSDSDLDVMKDAAKLLELFEVPYEIRIVSAHRTPNMMYSYALSALERGIQVIIAGAGGAAHLPGMVAAFAPLIPVIGVPVRTSTFNGIDSVLSILQMPNGAPVATVAINAAFNAGLLAVKILAPQDAKLRAKLGQYHQDEEVEVQGKDEKLQKVGWASYLNP